MAFMANSVNKASGIGSSPVARLLGAVPKRRLMKLATASPNIAPSPSGALVVAGSPRTRAPSAVAATAATTPRIVLDEPSEGHQPDFVRARVLTRWIAQKGYGRSSIPVAFNATPSLEAHPCTAHVQMMIHGVSALAHRRLGTARLS